MTIASFGPTASATAFVTLTSSNITLPTTGSPTVALVTNLGQQLVFLALGNNAVVATPTSLALMPGAQIALTIGAATNLAAVTEAGASAINVAVGN